MATMPHTPDLVVQAADTPLLRLTKVAKTFAGQQALKGVSLDVGAGEVVALLGENGSGKSTLVKILSGYHAPDPGCGMTLSSTPLVPGSEQAHQRLRFVHQDAALIDDMSVLENLCLGRGFHMRGIRIDWKKESAVMRERMARFGFAHPLSTPVARLNPAERAIVAIVRATEGWDARGGVLVLDEPTAFLHAREVDQLLDAVRVVAREGA